MAALKKSIQKLNLFMWKQYHLRKNRWILSSIELLLPILIVYGIAKSAEFVISSEGIVHMNATTSGTNNVSAIVNHHQRSCILYTPELPELKSLFEEYGNYTGSVKAIAVKNELALELLLANDTSLHEVRRGCVGVVFTDVSAFNRSGSFSYKLRSISDWNTDKVYYTRDNSHIDDGPIPYDTYFNEGFAGVQLAINEAFLKYQGKNPAYSQFRIQAFPYPEYVQENENRKAVPVTVCSIVLLTALILSVPLITTIIEEKTSGVRELMKIVGLEEWLIWLGWFLHALIFSLISYTVVTYLLQHDFFGPHSAAIRNMNPFVLWSCIMLYCIANIAFCFMFTAIFHQTTIASSVYVLTLAALMYASTLLTQMKYVYLRKIACLLPSAAFYLAFHRITYTEIHDIYLDWHNLFSVDHGVSTLSLGYTFMMMILDTLLYMFLAYYIGAINPGKFGAPKSPFFIFNSLTSALNKNAAQELVNLEEVVVDRFIEKPPSNLEATIKIKDLHKNFGSVYAVKGVNLNVYKGEITALLGHNGAGKTTTLAILTGIIKPTEGSIIYKDKLDVLKRMDEFRNNLGMCAQEDRLFPYLSVVNHLLFFGRLKGASKAEALKEAKEYMKLMEIAEKANSPVASLSGGMKRKLCLSIALMGKAETLILDEPTSGLDVESRRKLWDLLLEMRGSRTIILTTHHMEEADALGDRIAIMHHGTIVCHGTSLFLKKSYNTGYQVTITKDDNASDDMITSMIQNSGVVDVSLEGASPKEVVYKLPLVETRKFPGLFRRLEESKGQLGIQTIGVSCTTMEQVFLKVGGRSTYEPSMSRRGSTETDGGKITKLAVAKSSGIILVLQQIHALLGKRLLYTRRNWLNLFFRVVLPTFVMMVLLQGTTKYEHSEMPLKLDFSLYPNTKIMVQNSSESWPVWQSYQNLLESYGIELVASTGQNVTYGLIDYGRENLGSFKHDLILGLQMSDNDPQKTTLLYNRFALYSLPVGLNLFSNYLMKYRDGYSIEIDTTLHAIKELSVKCNPEGNANWMVIMFIWFIVMAFYMIDLNTYFMSSINVERMDGFKHIQLMSNVSPITYWLSNFIFDCIFFFLIVLVRIIIFKVVDDSSGFLSIDHHFFVLILIIAIFIASSMLFTYVLSYLSNSKDGSYLILFILNIVGAILVVSMYMVEKAITNEDLGYSWWAILYRVLRYVVLLVPPMNYSLIFIKFFFNWSGHMTCLNCESLSNVKCPDASYLVFQSENPNGILEEVLYLLIDIVLYAVLLGVIQIGLFEKLVNKAMIKIYGNNVSNKTKVSEAGDDDVEHEKAKVNRLINSSTGNAETTNNVLVVHKLRKNFIKLFRPFTAVADVNFTVKVGECFGLLGVNGAGKSTTFRMLTGDLLPTKGGSSIMGYKLNTNRTEYLSKAGYCAQSNCFLEELSGREMLSLIASLRGIRAAQLKDTVDKWLSILNLEEYQNQRCGSYSGGNKRKLCTAMSLIGDPHVVFLDEPTSGVDPVARRRLYTVMEQSRESGQAVVLTSHSMEECEHLCDRLTILVKGRMRCIGTAQHLKKIYAQGFSILIKISDTASSEALSTLKQRIENEFNGLCVLKDAHKTQLYYQITNINLLWSTLFEKMEKLKESNANVMEDYSLSDTSLEEVFISFAK